MSVSSITFEDFKSSFASIVALFFDALVDDFRDDGRLDVVFCRQLLNNHISLRFVIFVHETSAKKVKKLIKLT